MNRLKFHVKKGDVVQVITGNHKGTEGKILEVRRKKQQVIIEGIRLLKKHIKKSQEHPQGGIVEREGPIHISNVKLVANAGAEPEGKTKPKKKKE